MHPETRTWFEIVQELTKLLVAIPSVSPNLDAENHCAEAICALLKPLYTDPDGALDYQPVYWETNDRRKNVACLLKSKHPSNRGATIILMGHFDTVGVDDFARFGNSSIAFQPDELAIKMIAYLENIERDVSEESAFQALQSGEWMFGRGSVDMKAGVAVNIALMREFARLQANGQRLIDELAGNLLFLACPDEEIESAGILSAVPELLKLREAENLNYLGVINTDYTAPRDADENKRFIYSGTVGKLLPSFYILGVRTHVGEIYRGVDASQLAAELVSRINLSPAWMDTWEGSLGGERISEVALPPVALHTRDLKTSYNVETAGDAFVYVNWLTLQTTPEQAMQKMMETAAESLETVCELIEASYEDFIALGGESQPPAAKTGFVIQYETLWREAKVKWEGANQDSDFHYWLNTRISEFASSAVDSRDLSRMIVAELTRVAQISGPAVIVFFSPPYYPSVLPEQNDLTRAVKSVLDKTSRSIQLRGFYPYISDLSYVRLDNSVEVDLLKKNMPLFDIHKNNGEPYYTLDSEKLNAIRALDCPVINIGPFGRDAHGLYERVHMPYSFEVVPELIYRTISTCFELAADL